MMNNDISPGDTFVLDSLGIMIMNCKSGNLFLSKRIFRGVVMDNDIYKNPLTEKTDKHLKIMEAKLLGLKQSYYLHKTHIKFSKIILVERFDV